MSGEPSQTATAETRKLAAIMFTDMVGFSRQMGADEARMLRLLEVHDRIIQQAVTDHHGSIIKTGGDSFLVDFVSVVHAVQCAQQIQAQLQAHNVAKGQEEQIHVRVGVHLGDIVQRGKDVFGDGVNIAARLQERAEPDTVCISQKVYEEVEKKLALGPVVSLGRPKLKNIAQRFQVYALLPQPPKGVHQILHVQRLKLRRVAPVVFVLVSVLLFGGLVTFLFSSLSPFRVPQSAFRNQEALPLPDKPSIVVLPLVNLSGNPEQEYFGDGITEELTASLSRLSSLFVISRNSAFFYKGKAVKVQDISKELGVKYVLEGSVRKAGDQVRVMAQLIDATTDHHLWSERYDRPLKDIFAVQDEIVRKIVTTLKLQLTLWEQGIPVRKTTDNVDAYDYVLRGMAALIRTISEPKKEANEQARQMFEKAIELDPTYVGAYVELGWTYHIEWLWQWSQDPQTLERAFALAQKAIALDDLQAGPHRLLGQIYHWKKQYDQAIVEAQRVVALNPNNADGYMFLGNLLAWAERQEEGISLIEKAMRLNPRYPVWYLERLGAAYRAAGRCEEAIVQMKRVVTLKPNNPPAHFVMAICYVELGRQVEAEAEAAEVLRINPNFSLEVFKQMIPIKDPVLLERTLAAARKAGLK
jgi:adenylate cyclase